MVPALVFSARPDGSIDFVNHRWLEFTGLEWKALKDWGWRTALHTEDLGRFVEEWRATLPAEEPFEGETRIRRFDGQYRWFRIRKAPLLDERGTVVHWYGTGHDIEDLKRAEERIRQNEGELRTIIETIPACVVTALPDGSLDFVSQSFLGQAGLTKEQWLGSGWMTLIHPDDLDRLAENWREALETGRPIEQEARYRQADGSYRWFLGRNVPLRDENGNIVKWYGTLHDIEDRKRAEDALKRSEAYLAHAQLLTKVGSWAYIPPGVCEYWSAEMFRIFGIDPSMGYPSKDQLIARVHPEDRQLADEVATQKFKSGRTVDQKYRYLRPDGQLRVIRSFGTPVFENGVVTRFVGAAVDITEQEQRIEELRRNEVYLAEGQRIAHVGSWAFDLSGSFDHWSRELFQIYGLDPAGPAPTLSEYLGLVHPQDREFMAKLIETMVAEASGCDVKKRMVRPDGEVRYIRCVGVPVVENGNLKQIVGTAMDVTEQEHLTQELRRREAYLAEAQRLSATGSFGWRPSSGEILWSEEMYRIFDVDRATKPTAELVLKLTYPEDRDRVRELIEHTAREARDWDIEHRLLMADGTVKHLSVVVHVARDESGGPTEYVGAVMDVTAATESRRALEKAYEEIQTLKERLQKENIVLREEIDKTSMFEEIVGSSPALRRVLAQVEKVAPTDSTVLITGETGTGKELVARAIHKHSKRSARALVSVNCAAIPPSLIASELFGHEKGAFTGALQRRQGRFELADGGTIFLDEVGELPPEIQITLLRVLQEREFERVGGSRPIRTDVRVIAASNRDLEAAVAENTFRADLFYRLNVFPLEMPALRDRRADIPVLVEYFIHRYARRAGKRVHSINKTSLDLLKSYDWPGNVRELQNVVERAVIVSDSETLSIDERWLSAISATPREAGSRRLPTLATRERDAIETALVQTKGRVAGPFGAAARLGVPSSTLESKIRAMRIDKRRFKTPQPPQAS
jgi:PAS domain S-box-containing protein